MEKYELQKLRDLPIEGVAERLGLQVSRHKCLCPFHDDHHASLSFKNGKWKCWSCGESGDTISLVMKVLGKDFKEATRWLADENCVIVSSFRVQGSSVQEPKPFDASRYERFFERPWLSIEARKFLFDERKIDPRVVRWARLTSWQDKKGVNWLQIPYYNQAGKLVGIQNRNLGCKVQGSRVQGAPRFRFPSGSQCSIYNLPILNLLHEGEDLYITEGCSDCWAMLSSGHKAIAIPSATLLNTKDAELLSTLNAKLSTKFHMFPDRDEPGERLFLQLKEVLPNLEHHQLPLGCKDYGEYYVQLKVDS